MFLFLQLHLGGRADLDDRDAAGQLREALLQLFAVVVRVGVVDLGLDLVDPTLDVGLVARALDDGRLVLGDDHLASPAQHVEVDVLELEANLFRDDLPAREDRHVLQHRLAALTKARRLHRCRLEGATNLVDDQGRERFALDVFADDHQRAARLHDLFENRQQVTHS